MNAYLIKLARLAVNGCGASRINIEDNLKTLHDFIDLVEQIHDLDEPDQMPLELLPSWLLKLIGDHGYTSNPVRYNETERLHRWGLLIDGIKHYANTKANACRTIDSAPSEAAVEAAHEAFGDRLGWNFEGNAKDERMNALYDPLTAAYAIDRPGADVKEK